MKIHTLLPGLLLLLPLAVSAQQAGRPAFQRPTFDRSGYTRGGSAAPAAAPAVAEETAAAVSAPSTAATYAPTNPFGQTNVYYATDAEGKNVFGQQVTRTAFGGETQALAAAPLFDQLPRKPIPLRRTNDWAEILALQEQTGACILIHFIQTGMAENSSGIMDSSEKGRASWFEKKNAGHRRWRNAIAHYIQVSVNLPGNREVQAFEKQIRNGQKNLYYVIQPGDRRSHLVRVFEYDTVHRELNLLDIDACMNNLRNASTPAYAEIAK